MSLNIYQLESFVRESNKIENIDRTPHNKEVEELKRFINLRNIEVSDLEDFVKVYEPAAYLRRRAGMDVMIGSKKTIGGGPIIESMLTDLLKDAYSNFYPNEIHKYYELLHPFMDCNGRSGRALWLWQMVRLNRNTSLGFLHTYYYQTLN